MSSETMRYATGHQTAAARALGADVACWHATLAAAPTAGRPMAVSSKQAIRVNVTDFGPRPPLEPSP